METALTRPRAAPPITRNQLVTSEARIYIMSAKITTTDINTAARDIAAKSMSRDRFDITAAITAQMSQWFGNQRGEQYAETRILLTNETMHRITEAQWRLSGMFEQAGE